MTTTTIHCISLSNILGNTAKFAVQQSPYAVPDGLAEVLHAFESLLIGSILTEKFPDFWCGDFTRAQLKVVIRRTLLTIPQVLKWNDRKNGNDSPFQFVSRYDGKRNPDNDFIDLDALTRNIAAACAKDSVV